jgi:hypothetical protein
VVEKSDYYDDGNWHAEQPKQYPTSHERLPSVIHFKPRRPVNAQKSVLFRRHIGALHYLSREQTLIDAAPLGKLEVSEVLRDRAGRPAPPSRVR